MEDPKLKRTSVQIKYTSTDGSRAEFCGKAGTGSGHRVTGKEVPPQHALIAGFEELARLTALFGFEAEARKAADDAFKRVAEWRAGLECRTNPAQGPDSPMVQVPTPGTTSDI